MNKFYIEDPYSSNPKVYQYPVDGIDDGALVVVELGPVLKTMSDIEYHIGRAMFNSNLTKKDRADLNNALEIYELFKKSLK